jgi:hypothetical protein
MGFMRPARSLVVPALIIAWVVPVAPIAFGDKAPDPAVVAKFLSGMAKRKSLSSRDREELRKRLDSLDEAGLLAVRDALRGLGPKDRGEAATEVIGSTENALLSMRWGPGVLSLPGAIARFEEPSPDAKAALLVDLARIEDAEPGTRLGLWAIESADLALRLRAVDVLADLASYAGDSARLLPPLRKALGDPSAAVRDLALERLVELCDVSALDWALEHCMDPAEETVTVREVEERRCPGERAFLLLARTSKQHTDVEPGEVRSLPTEKRELVLADFRTWRAGVGGSVLRDGSDGPFDPTPKVTTVLVPKDVGTEVVARWWSEIDRAAFRMTLEDLTVVASSTRDWSASWRAVVIASGARQGNWETFARRVRCGGRHRLPRQGFALVETTVQTLLDGRYKVYVRAYESR